MDSHQTIPWNTDYSSCYSRYTIIKKTLENNPKDFEYIIYKLNRPSKSCSWSYIGLYYYDALDGPMVYHWAAAGFPTLVGHVIENAVSH